MNRFATIYMTFTLHTIRSAMDPSRCIKTRVSPEDSPVHLLNLHPTIRMGSCYLTIHSVHTTQMHLNEYPPAHRFTQLQTHLLRRFYLRYPFLPVLPHRIQCLKKETCQVPCTLDRSTPTYYPKTFRSFQWTKRTHFNHRSQNNPRPSITTLRITWKRNKPPFQDPLSAFQRVNGTWILPKKIS